MAEKDLNYYLNGRMDQLPSDPAEIEKLAAATAEAAMDIADKERVVDEPARAAAANGDPSAAPAGDDAAKAEAERKAAEEANAKAEAERKAEEEARAKAEADAKAQADAGGKIEGVLLKDGKTLLPYEVHHAVRMRAQTAEAGLVELAKDKAELQKQVETLTQQLSEYHNATAAGKVEISADIKEHIDAVRSEMPQLADLMEKVYADAVARAEKVARAAVPAAPHDDAAVADTAQTLVEQIPTLAVWEAGGNADADARWGKAVEFDKQLLADPAWKDKPDLDRFERVVAMTKAYFGDASDAGDRRAGAEPAADPQPSKEELERKAKEKLDTTGASAERVPSSLSSIPGGAPGATDEMGKLEAMDVAQLGDMLMRKGAAGGADAIFDHLRSL